MVTPAVKREAVAHLTTEHEMSERRACRVIGCQRMTVRSDYPDDPVLRERLRPLPGNVWFRLSPASDLPAPEGRQPQAAPHLREERLMVRKRGRKRAWEQGHPWRFR
jgi:putative transposase